MRNLALGSLAILTLAIVGCGGGPMTPVTVQVLLDGQPLPNARVEFNPTDSKLKSAFGMTDAQGYAKINTMGEDDGAMPGEYKVVVVANEPGPMGGGFPGATKKVAIKSLVHENYTRLDKTPLKVAVPGVSKLELNKSGM